MTVKEMAMASAVSSTERPPKYRSSAMRACQLSPSDHHGGWQAERVMQAFGRAHQPATRDLPLRQGLHPQDRDALLDQLRQHVLLETSEMRVQNVQRHLAAIEMELVLRGHVQHAQVHDRVLVSGKPDEPDLARLLGLLQRLQSSARRKEAGGVLQPDVLVRSEE